MGAPRSIETRAAGAILALAAACAAGYEDGAPPGHTGGFGEPDCTACHSDNDRNSAAGRLVVDGLPSCYAPGRLYRLAVVLEHPELEAGGFQLAFRTPAGEPAGRPVSPNGRTRIVSDGGQPYLQHQAEGRKPAEDGRIRWEIEWEAPAAGTQVTLHVAANAANDDLSELGDFIFTLERELLSGADAAGQTSAGCSTGSSLKR